MPPCCHPQQTRLVSQPGPSCLPPWAVSPWVGELIPLWVLTPGRAADGEVSASRLRVLWDAVTLLPGPDPPPGLLGRRGTALRKALSVR